MDIVLIRPTTGARRATRRTALAAALLLASSTLAVSVPQQADAGISNACADVFAPDILEPLVAPTLVDGSYEIDSEKKLVFLSANANEFLVGGSGPRWREQDFLQTADLDLGGCEFTSIGRDGVGNYYEFNGTYDGGGHTISGLLIDELTRGNVGFFAHADDATLRNIHFLEPNVKGKDYTGVLTGQLGDFETGRGLVENVSVSGGRVEASESVGGLVGYIASGQLRNSQFAGEVHSGRRSSNNYSGAGGLAGENAGEIAGSSASGSVAATGNYVGGLVGDDYGSITNSWATGDVEGLNFVGGLAGGSGVSPITASYATGEVSGTDGVGGLVGKLFSNGTVADSFAKGDVTGTATYVGGLVGEALGTITNAYATGDVSGDVRVGGLVGLSEGDVTNAFSVGRVTGTGNFVGGLIGDEDDGDRIALFWDVETSGIPAGNSEATGLTTAEMTSFATFDTAWNTASTVIVEGWQAPSNPTWGICSRANDGYPFLLWQFDTDPCVDPVVVSAGEPTSTLAVACDGPLAVGGTVTCAVTGGDAGFEILWRAAFNPPFAGAGVTLGADGTGTFSFVVPAAALGQELTVELVEWTQPMTLGVVGGPVPASVPAGEGGVPLGAVLLALLAAAGALLAGRRLVTVG